VTRQVKCNRKSNKSARGALSMRELVATNSQTVKKASKKGVNVALFEKWAQHSGGSQKS